MKTGIVAILTLLLTSCFPGSGERYELNERYEISAIDVDSQMSLYRRLPDGNGIGRIGPTVFAAGFDDHFIIAKRHPNNSKDRTEYFILDTTKDSDLAEPSQSVRGPLSESEFREARLKLGVSPTLDFTVVVQSLR